MNVPRLLALVQGLKAQLDMMEDEIRRGVPERKPNGAARLREQPERATLPGMFGRTQDPEAPEADAALAHVHAAMKAAHTHEE